MAFALDNDDINGACFIVGAEGEIEAEVDTNEVVFPDGCPAATEATIGQHVVFTANQALVFVQANYITLIQARRTPEQAAKVAYLRFLAARNGLISPEFGVAAHNVRYNDAHRLTALATRNVATAYTDDGSGGTAFGTHLTAQNRALMRNMFSDYVCCVAYIFRVRGHHYRADFQGRYDTLWARCLHGDNERILPWEYLATDAFHCIMPDVLDDYWSNCVQNSRCAGTLIKRFDSAPAGVAGVLALKRGLDDVSMLFPTVADRVPDSKTYFNAVYTQVEGSRWAGSVNHRYYGENRIRVDEAKIGALASVVMGIYDQLAPSSKLRNSPALQRLAEIAPATGGAIGIAAMRTAKDDRMNLLEDTLRVLPSGGA